MILTDAGPLIAIFDPGEEKQHIRCVALMDELRGPMVTTLPSLTESMYFLGDSRGWYGQSQLWKTIGDGSLRILGLSETDIARMHLLMDKYSDIPMDFADASLIVAAENLNTKRIFTLDSDFTVYRINGRTSFEIIP